MILEGIVTTVNENGTTNISPMGPLVESESFSRLILRPFQSSTTYRNLRRTRKGVLHVTDDVLLMAKSAIGCVSPEPPMVGADKDRRILANCCRWFAFVVEKLDDSADRTVIDCRVNDSGQVRDFFGFNRAKHAVIEAAILATRVHFLSMDEIKAKFVELAVLVDKTGGDSEQEAFALLQSHVDAYWRQRA